jgi:glutamate 5-kinase
MSTLALDDLRRLVVKIGSALLVDNTNRINRDWLDDLADDVAILRAAGHQVLIVSSGAVAIGSHVLGINPRRSRLEELQAAAAAGQVQLVHAYQDALGRHDIRAAQILLTPDDTEVRRRFLNARGTLEKLLEHDIVPVINENDTVATDELRYGDNDRLAARVAQTVMADGLILLSDVDGFYTADPRANAEANHIGFVDKITEEHFDMAGDSGSSIGSGGMRTKLQAARKQWLAGVLEVCGELHLDAGAATALANGNSLLPVGMTEVVGNFGRGDAVTLVGADGRELGRGLAAYASDEALAIKGCRSEQIEGKLGYRGRSVMVHRDDMVLFSSK